MCAQPDPHADPGVHTRGASATPGPARPIRVVICDDSPFMRRMLRQTLENADGIQVVGSAATAGQAVELCNALRPDVMTLDLQLPDLDGVRVLQHVRGMPVRVLVVSAFAGEGDTDRAVEALAEGAIDCIGKPSLDRSAEAFFEQLLERVRTIAGGATYLPRATVRDAANRVPQHRLMVIGSSTGGPRALHALLPALPADFGAPIVVVQHMPVNFTNHFARRLDDACAMRVVNAEDGMLLQAGTVHLAVPGSHLHIEGNMLAVREGPRVNGLVPAIDVTMIDAATSWGSQVTGIVLTGIGKDGCAGARAIREAGGRVLAEHESTCAVYGMPRAVIEAELADQVCPLDAMAQQMVEEVYA